MVTIANIASESPQVAYYELTASCERILQLAKKLEHLARSDKSFAEDPQFQRLAKDFHEHLASTVQVSNVLHNS